MSLADLWFILITVLWAGYFMLEGFDFGVGILFPVLGRDDIDRRVMVNTIGPVWDGNETWVVAAGAATFAAFPEWYASLFSGFYLPLLIILVALIVRGLAFEYRGKGHSERWKRGWDLAIFWGSLVPAVLWGVAFANILRGVPMTDKHEVTASVFSLLNPYGLLGGLTTLGLFATHGAVFLALKTVGDIRERARRTAWSVGLISAALAVVFLVWTQIIRPDAVGAVLSALAALLFVAGLLANQRGRDGVAFSATAAALVVAVVSLFVTLYPAVLPSLTGDGLTVDNASSSPYTLRVMTVVAAIFGPIVVAYQAWTYYIFRKRIGREHIPAEVPVFEAPMHPGAAAASRGGRTLRKG
ncbi:MAG TPA: cytochrome d ubiquinol oxidase subunit II [Pseudonocardiaceae bacterium]